MLTKKSYFVKNYLFILIGIVSLSFISCIDEEGEGGTSVIEGKVFKVLHPDDNFPITSYNDTLKSISGADSIVIKTDTILRADTFPAAKEDVYIVYGNEPIYGDKMETGKDGNFRFRYLTKGTYYIYAYTKTPDGQKEAVIDTVTIASGEVKSTRNIYIHEGKSLDKSYIKGTVMVRYYDKGAFITGLMPAYETRVYIRTKGNAYHFEETRTSIQGVFMFQELSPGDYEVFVITEQPGYKVLSPIIQSVTIEKKGIIKTMNTPFNIIINA